MRHIKMPRELHARFSCLLQFSVSAPKLCICRFIDTSTPGVFASFSVDGNADTSRVLTDNSQHSGHQTLSPVSMVRLLFALDRTTETPVRTHSHHHCPDFLPLWRNYYAG